jgi:hypothetical protein
VRRRGIGDGILFGVLASLSVYAHVFAAFPIVVLAAFVLVRAGRRAALATAAVGVAAAVPAIFLVAGQTSHWLAWKGDVAGAYRSSPLNLVAAGQALFTGYALPVGGTAPSRLLGLVAVAALLALSVGLAWRERISARWLLLALVVVGIAAPWVLQMRTRMYAPRFALGALPPLLLLVAAGLARARPGVRIAVTGAVVALSLGLAAAGGVGRTDWREVAEHLRRERAPDSALEFEGGNVVALREWFGEPFRGGAPAELDGTREIWRIRVTPPEEVEPPAPYVRTVRRFGPARRIVEDEAPWVVRWRVP